MSHRARADLDVGQATDIGLQRALNEDSIYCSSKLGLFIVADGMGGHDCGEVASGIAVSAIGAAINEGATVVESVVAADRAIVSAIQAGQGSANMGTTTVVLLIEQDSFHIAWVGDSRAYCIRHGIKQLSCDHSLVQEMVSQSLISEDQARTHPRRNVITRSLGQLDGDNALVDRVSGEIRQDDVFVLCSDGLSGPIADDDIERIVREASNAKTAADSLVKAALDSGGADNISVIVVRVRESARKLTIGERLRRLFSV